MGRSVYLHLSIYFNIYLFMGGGHTQAREGQTGRENAKQA